MLYIAVKQVTIEPLGVNKVSTVLQRLFSIDSMHLQGLCQGCIC